jgi:uncharacterized protein YjeT (DUF2065 family)
MSLVNYLAEIWGISITVVSLALLVKESHLRRLFASLETEDNLFSWGLISFVIGMVMVLNYNVWTMGWQVVITILGWASLVKGLFLLFMPEFSKKYAKKLENAPILPFALLILLIIGLAITYLGFTA